MKAYILQNPQPLTPLNRAVSSIPFRHETIGQRLRRQLSESGFAIEVVQSTNELVVDPQSIVVQDDVLFSDSFFDLFLNNIPDNSQNYQCHLDGAKSPILVEQDPEADWQAIPLYYFGSESNFNDTLKQPMQLDIEIVFTIDQGVPARMNELRALRCYIPRAFAHHIVYWFDLQTATALYTREYVAKNFTLAKRFLPNVLVERILHWQWLMERSNSIGKNCRIHPTAILEGCVVGDNVEIGPFSYLRSSVIDDDVVLREKTSVKMAYLGKGAFVMGSDIVNCYVGAESSIITPMLYNVVFGEGSFVSGGSGFADFNVGSGSVTTRIDGEEINSGLTHLGSCVGENSFIGANMIFAPGRVIPNGTNFLDNGLIKDMPTEPDGTYVLSGTQLLQIPNNFIGAKKS